MESLKQEKSSLHSEISKLQTESIQVKADVNEADSDFQNLAKRQEEQREQINDKYQKMI